MPLLEDMRRRLERQLPVLRDGGLPALSDSAAPVKTPPAVFIYGMAAGIMLAVGISFFFAGRWLAGGLMLLPALAFGGYAWLGLRGMGKRGG